MAIHKKFLIFIFTIKNIFSLGWEQIEPDKQDDKFFFHGEGFTSANLSNPDFGYSDAEFPDRHSYFWFHLNVGYEILDNFWLTGWSSLSKISFSTPISMESFRFDIFPLLTYSNLGEFQDESNNSSNSLKLKSSLGMLCNFTNGQGLFFNQFVSPGAEILLGYKSSKLILTHLATGYEGYDDVFTYYIYPYKKFFGIGLIHEVMGYFGDRIVPGIIFEFNFVKKIRFYSETGVSYVYNRNNQTYNRFVEISTTNRDADTGEYLPIYENRIANFESEFSINKNTLATLIGVDWNFELPLFLKLKINLVNQFRYYGKDNSMFYQHSASFLHGFNYYYDPSIDQKYNNQPHNFYIYPGEKMGMYFRQEIEFNPFGLIYITFRNEFLWIYITSSVDDMENLSPYGDDILSLLVYFRFKDHLDVGLQFSNISIGAIESEDINGSYKPEGLFLQDSTGYMLNLFIHYFF